MGGRERGSEGEREGGRESEGWMGGGMEENTGGRERRGHATSSSAFMNYSSHNIIILKHVLMYFI